MNPFVAILIFLAGCAVGAGLVAWLYQRTLVPEYRRTRQEREEERARREELEQEATRLRTQLEFTEGKVRLALQDQMQKVMQEVRQQLHDLLKSTGTEWVERADRVEKLVQPLQERLQKVEEVFHRMQETIHSIEEQRREQTGRVQQLLEDLQSGVRELGRLREAFMASGQQRGSWGEVTLQRLLEWAGMRKGQEYFWQPDFGPIRPDAAILLPDGGVVLVDAKAPLKPYFDAVEAESEAEAVKAFREFRKKVQEEASKLRAKGYVAGTTVTLPNGETAEIARVVLFIPLESAVQELLRDEEFWEFMSENEIGVAGPLNLLLVLKMLAYVWRPVRLSESLERYREEVAAFCEDVRNLLEQMQTLGGHLQKAYNRWLDLERAQGRLRSALARVQAAQLPGEEP